MKISFILFANAVAKPVIEPKRCDIDSEFKFDYIDEIITWFIYSKSFNLPYNVFMTSRISSIPPILVRTWLVLSLLSDLMVWWLDVRTVFLQTWTVHNLMNCSTVEDRNICQSFWTVHFSCSVPLFRFHPAIFFM